MSNPPAGWYADPERPESLRWWDGAAWGPTAPPREAPVVRGTNGAGIVSLVLGIIAMLSCAFWTVPAITGPVGVIGLVAGFVGLAHSRDLPGIPKGTWIAGLTLNALALVILVGLIAR